MHRGGKYSAPRRRSGRFRFGRVGLRLEGGVAPLATGQPAFAFVLGFSLLVGFSLTLGESVLVLGDDDLW
jgi:hypothetical protein